MRPAKVGQLREGCTRVGTRVTNLRATGGCTEEQKPRPRRDLLSNADTARVRLPRGAAVIAQVEKYPQRGPPFC